VRDGSDEGNYDHQGRGAAGPARPRAGRARDDGKAGEARKGGRQSAAVAGAGVGGGRGREGGEAC